jgi:hypothetical protein
MQEIKSFIPHYIKLSEIPNRFLGGHPGIILYDNEHNLPFKARIDLRDITILGRDGFDVHLFIGGQWHRGGIEFDDSGRAISKDFHPEEMNSFFHGFSMHWVVERGLTVLVDDTASVRMADGGYRFYKFIEDEFEGAVVLLRTEDGYYKIGTADDIGRYSKARYAEPYNPSAVQFDGEQWGDTSND